MAVAPLPEMKQHAGITVGGDSITVHCGEKSATLSLENYIKDANAGRPAMLMQWVVFWQLLTLNQNAQAARENASNQDPADIVGKILEKYAHLMPQPR